MNAKVSLFAGLLLVLFGASAANAAEIDFAPLVGAAIQYFLMPISLALAAWVVALIGVILKRFAARYPAWLDQKTANLLAQNVDGILHWAISAGVLAAQKSVNSRDLHADVDGWVASYAAEYAVKHAPQIMKQAGDVTEKIFARLAQHPDVLDLKAAVAVAADQPVELHPAAA